MNMIWLCLPAVLCFTSVICGQSIDSSHIRVFPAMDQSIAGVFQVSSLNHLNQPQYAFDASEARSLCSSLGVDIASKAQVKTALNRGLETCRFGWIDEHLAVIPRIQSLSTCGQSRTGLVTWRASVTKRFDVFCFNESDAVTQLKDATTTSPLNSSDHSEQTNSTQTTQSTSSSSSSPRSSSTSAPQTRDKEAVPARYVGSAIRSAGGKVVLITSTCGLLLTAIILIVYLKSRRIGSQSLDMKQQQESIETEDWTCVKSVEQTEEDAQEEEKIQVEDEDKDVSLNLSDSDVTE
ncbi:lymphatic vessel endothelial hyaluronic acid receptor 1a [Pleuronectes platessa]|uniref:lymphatic vessel endothelial hyaluronic acid receptor 1a n=1 Tax=Pleuronectes platessa TaxID=8262 RepID=UPI00232A4AC2|nr:lymphatic vessel endothelial hyaluronic acid receptor 1a [Pleuronectes platessa]